MGLLSLFRRKKASAQRHQALAMVLLSDTKPPAPGDVVATLRELVGGDPPVLDLETKETASVASIPGGSIGILHIPMPVPASDLEGPTQVAWHWPEARVIVPQHQSHVICFGGSDKLDRIAVRLLHSKLVAAVAANANALGVYVGDGMLVRKADEYDSEARAGSRYSLPLLLWIGFNPVGSEGQRSAYTTGLSSFDLLELEAHDSERPWAELMGRLADFAHYEITAGLQVGDGETIGSSQEERIAVKHTRSRFIPDATVALVDL